MIRIVGLLIASALAVIGIRLAAPAQAAPFKNCTQAKAAGYCDIPEDSPYYGSWLDRDQDGLGCEC